MEEILASIRRIIADDQSLPARGTASAPLDEAIAEDQSRQDRDDRSQDARIQGRLREHRTSGGKSDERPAFQTDSDEMKESGEPQDHDVEEGDFYGAPAPAPEKRTISRDTPPPRAPVPPIREDSREKAPLFSPATDTAVQSAFNMLAASRLANNSDEIMTLAREMIRPLLRTWIDDNLPSMVERMVRAEIERVARGR